MSDWLFVLGLCAPPLCVVAGFAGLLLAARPVDRAHTTRPHAPLDRQGPADASLLTRPTSV